MNLHRNINVADSSDICCHHVFNIDSPHFNSPQILCVRVRAYVCVGGTVFILTFHISVIEKKEKQKSGLFFMLTEKSEKKYNE